MSWPMTKVTYASSVGKFSLLEKHFFPMDKEGHYAYKRRSQSLGWEYISPKKGREGLV